MKQLLAVDEESMTATLEPGLRGPEAEALLNERGFETILDPMMTIVDIDAPEMDLSGIQALLMTSANGVRAFARREEDRQTPVYVVGDASAQVARDLGFIAVTSAGGDVETLAALVQNELNPGQGALLHIAASRVAGDLSGLLEAAGFEVRRLVLYEATAADALSPKTLVELDAGTLDDADMAFAQDHLRILSGLYGLLRPLDLIQPYRLEMGSRFNPPRGGDLYEFWDGRLTAAINRLSDIENRLQAEQSVRARAAEGRILPVLGLLLLLLIGAIVLGAILVARAAQAETEAAQARELEIARDRANLLAQELNHRVKNLFAMVLAIVQMSAREASEVAEYKERIVSRIHALLTAHEVSQGELERPVASLRALVETSLAPYRSSKHPAEIEGPDVMLPAKRVTPLGLVLHELTTNAVKYGAWKNRGTVHVSWTEDEGMLTLTWRESGADLEELPERKGFGSLLMTSAARQFGGTFERNFTKDGLQVSIVLPVTD